MPGRRALMIAGAGALARPALAAKTTNAAAARVLVVGGGWGGLAAARALRRQSAGRIDVTLVEPAADFVSCPLSNLVLEGSQPLSVLTRSYAALSARDGVRVLHDAVAAFDPLRKTATLASGAVLGWDRLVLSPGVEMVWDGIEGLRAAHERGLALHAFKAGAETLALRRQLEAMPDGGIFAISIPEAPFRCPPAPYERACVVAAYFRREKPRSKVIVVDANEDVASKGALFRKVWAEDYKGIVDYQPQTKTVAVDAATKTLKFEIQDELRADVLNVLPPMRAGAVAVQGGLANSNARWVNVRFPDFESTAAKHVHVIGDSIQIAPGMPKSGHMAASQGRALASLLAAELLGRDRPDPLPRLDSTCYSFVDARRAMHIASSHAFDAAQQTYLPVHGVGGSSDAPSAAEGEAAWRWARQLWDELLA